MESIVSRTLSVGQEHELLQKLEAAGLTARDAQRVIDSPGNGLAESILSSIREGVVTTPAGPPSYRLTIDRNMDLREMIHAGTYYEVNENIVKHFSDPKGSGLAEVEALLVHPGRDLVTDEALRAITEAGCVPAGIEVLLAFGANPKTRMLQLQFPILALGSTWTSGRGDTFVPYLYCDKGNRHLYLGWCDQGRRHWTGSCRFLAIR